MLSVTTATLSGRYISWRDAQRHNRHAKRGGEGGIRTLAPANNRPNGLANRPLQPLGYLSITSKVKLNMQSLFQLL